MVIGLKLRYRGLSVPPKFKLGILGCPWQCVEAHGKNVGVIYR